MVTARESPTPAIRRSCSAAFVASCWDEFVCHEASCCVCKTLANRLRCNTILCVCTSLGLSRQPYVLCIHTKVLFPLHVPAACPLVYAKPDLEFRGALFCTWLRKAKPRINIHITFKDEGLVRSKLRWNTEASEIMLSWVKKKFFNSTSSALYRAL